MMIYTEQELIAKVHEYLPDLDLTVWENINASGEPENLHCTIVVGCPARPTLHEQLVVVRHVLIEFCGPDVVWHVIAWQQMWSEWK